MSAAMMLLRGANHLRQTGAANLITGGAGAIAARAVLGKGHGKSFAKSWAKGYAAEIAATAVAGPVIGIATGLLVSTGAHRMVGRQIAHGASAVVNSKAVKAETKRRLHKFADTAANRRHPKPQTLADVHAKGNTYTRAYRLAESRYGVKAKARDVSVVARRIAAKAAAQGVAGVKANARQIPGAVRRRAGAMVNYVRNGQVFKRRNPLYGKQAMLPHPSAFAGPMQPIRQRRAPQVHPLSALVT
jgi:hypothetical protein